MQNSNFWRQLHLFRTKTFGIGLLLGCFLLLSSTSSEAQWFRVKKRDVTNYNRHAHNSLKRSKRKHLHHPIHYGFFIGGHSSRFIANFNDMSAFTTNVGGVDFTTTNISPKSSFGFSLGFVINFKLADFWDLRVLPTAAFYERNIDYTLQDNLGLVNTTSTQVLEATMVELPILFKYKSQLRGISGMHLVAGIKPGISVTSQKEEEEASLRTTGFDLAIEYGIGFDSFFKFFKFSPEIRFSHGIVNNLEADNNALTRPLNRLTTNSISLYLHFE